MFRNALSAFLVVLFLSLPFLALASVPSLDSELICHTSNEADCYPRLFEPAADFQLVRDDQDLPPGLHVRLNLETGKKEAKLYDPREDDPSLNAIELAVGESIQVVPGHEEPVDEPLSAPSLPDAPAHPAKQPWKPLDNLYQKAFKSHAGGPKKPAINTDGDGTAFGNAVQSLLADGAPAASALDALEDLSRDIYWGQVLGERALAVQRLVELLDGREGHEIAGRAALVLGNAVHNNDAALRAVASYSFGGSGAEPESVYEVLLRHLRLTSEGSEAGRPEHGLPAATYPRFIYLLSSLLQHPEYHTEFLSSGRASWLADATHFRAHMVGTTPEWDRSRAKLADLVLDHVAQPERLPSVTACKVLAQAAADEAAGEAAGEAAASPAEGAASGPIHPKRFEMESCREDADLRVGWVLFDWIRLLEFALEQWDDVPDGPRPDAAVVEHFKEALDGMYAALRAARWLEMREFYVPYVVDY